MWKFKRNNKRVPKYLKRNNAPSGKYSAAPKQPVPGSENQLDQLNQAKKNITRQALLAGLTVVLTIVILFAMTSAWYTNIVQTSGLVFEAESWGFDGEIEIDRDPISAAPGDEGAVNLKVQNKSQNISAISFNVSKLDMNEEMQKRLFLYVDTQMNRDNETMDRVYLNSQEGYTYTVFANGSLMMSEKGSNAPQLKWQWVYDVLGYYVIAETQTLMDNGKEVQRTTVQEYLRPIEYNYDDATTVLREDAQGNIQMVMTTVDGTRSPEAFLQKLSQTDGYEGQINPAKKTSDGYYPVAVDEETGYGVYAYLCSHKEIQDATEYDTYLGKLAYQLNVEQKELDKTQTDLLSSYMTLIISAQKNESTAVNVTRLNDLQQAITQSKADVIQLSEDIDIPADKSLTIPANTRTMLDLNGKTITCHSARAIDVLSGSSLTMINGNLVGPDASSKTYGVYTTGAEVIMSDVDISNFQYGVFMGDNVANNPLDSRVHMVGCKVEAGNYAVFANGNGIQSAQKSQLILEKCELSSNAIVLTSNGSADRAGTDIQIYDSTISAVKPAADAGVSRGIGIYHPQKDSTMRIVNSTVSGYSGVVIKGGAVSIEDSVIEGTGAYQQAAVSNSGFTDTGDAVYIETGFGYEIQLEISGEKTVLRADASQSKSLHIFPEDSANVSVTIYGGTFDEKQPEEYIAEGSVQDGTKVTVKKQ